MMARLPNYAVPTGEFIQEWMDDKGVTGADMARRLGVSAKHVSELLSGGVALTPAIAVALESVTGVPADHWSRMEALYRADLVRLAAEAELVSQYERVKAFPLKFLRRLGFITAGSDDKPGVVRQFYQFFRVTSMNSLEVTWRHGVAYRRAAAANSNSEALLTWLTVAERDIEFASLAHFDKDALRRLIPVLRAMSCDTPSAYVKSVTSALAGVGVALCLVPEVPGLGIHGATRWINGHPVIQLSLRGKTDDQLWFTLFHEIGHVMLHDARGLFLSGIDSQQEAEADQFAADTLIPPLMADRLPLSRNLTDVRQFAAEIGIAPGVVLGRIQHETGDYGWGHQLKQHFEFSYH